MRAAAREALWSGPTLQYTGASLARRRPPAPRTHAAAPLPMQPFTVEMNSLAPACSFRIANHLNATDRWWTRITIGDQETTDGIVPGPSQVYPNAIQNIKALGAASHTAQTDSRKSSEAIRDVLDEFVGVDRTET